MGASHRGAGIGALGRNSLWMFAATLTRVASQGIAFLLVARTLQPSDFGAFVSCLALAAAFAPFAGLGSGNLLVRDVSRRPDEFGQYWGRTLCMLSISASAALILFVPAALVILPSTVLVSVVVALGLSELLLARLVEVCGQAFQAHEELRRTAQLQGISGLIRLFAALGFFVVAGPATASTWALFYLGSTAICALIAYLMVASRFGHPELRLRPSWDDAREGAMFAVSLSAQSVYNDSDKVILARSGTLADVANYAVAYRIVDYSFVPVASLLAASYSRFFLKGAAGIASATSFARRLLPFAVGFGALSGLCVLVAAPVVPLAIGSEYAAAVSALRWLAPLGLFRALHYLAADSLSGAGHQRIRAMSQVAVAVLNVAVCLVIIPRFSWHGAAAVSIASDGLLACVLWGIVARIRRRERLASPIGGGRA